jgi:hypothetical protein
VPQTSLEYIPNTVQAWATNVTSGTAPTTITITGSGSGSFIVYTVDNYTGSANPFVLDGSVALTTNQYTDNPIQAFTTGATVAGDLLWSLVDYNGTGVPTVASPFTMRQNGGSNGYSIMLATADAELPAGAAANTSYTASYSISSGQSWSVAVAGFKKSPVVYYTSYTTAPYQVFEGTSRLTRNMTSYASLAAGEWYLDTAGSKIWVRMTGDDNPSGHTVKASVRTTGVTITAHPYITLNNLDVEAAAGDNIYVSGAASHLVVTGVTSNFATYSGIYLGALESMATTMQSPIIQDSTFSYNWEKGVFSLGAADSLLIQSNTVNNNCIGTNSSLP